MKEYRVRCEWVEIKNDGKETRRMAYPINEYGSSILTTFKSYEDAYSACEKYRAYAAKYEKHNAEMRKHYPKLYMNEIRFDNFRIETREVTEWTL